jgi:hypothetical protein
METATVRTTREAPTSSHASRRWRNRRVEALMASERRHRTQPQPSTTTAQKRKGFDQPADHLSMSPYSSEQGIAPNGWFDFNASTRSSRRRSERRAKRLADCRAQPHESTAVLTAPSPVNPTGRDFRGHRRKSVKEIPCSGQEILVLCGRRRTKAAPSRSPQRPYKAPHVADTLLYSDAHNARPRASYELLRAFWTKFPNHSANPVACARW